jgi:hypothetical protein
MADNFMESLFRQAQRPPKGTALGKLNEARAHVYHGGHPFDQDIDDAGAGEGGDYWYGNEPEDTHQAHYPMQVRSPEHEAAPEGEYVDEPETWGGYSSDQGRHEAPPQAQRPAPPLQASMRQQQYMKDQMRLNKINKQIAQMGIEREEIKRRLQARR